MNTTILHENVQQFISENLQSNITKLILKGSPFKNVTIQELSNQIVSKIKAKDKLPNWFLTNHIYYPAKISIEQTSSEETAIYKKNLLTGLLSKSSAQLLIDITGGFGVDAFYFSKYFKQVIHAEINKELSKIVTYNYQQLAVKNIQTVATNGLDYLKETSQKFDCIYIDPSRRDDVKGKVFLLKDCLPNVPENIDFLFTKSDVILIKNSPMLDIKATLNELKFVKEIHVVAVNNEVKELLFLLNSKSNQSIEIKTVNILRNSTQEFIFLSNEKHKTTYSNPLDYLYEPNAAILKSGGFNEVSKAYNIAKLQQHSHLYTSKEILVDFPGRVFKVIAVYPYNKKKIKKELTMLKANITTRNFPKTVAQIRAETKLKDGGDVYLFFTTNNSNERIVIQCSKTV
ncbi:class I SAM-dependent methyltransferase [Tenacibaculum finnmarkense]|uniref:Class I SAM-dependent methyltransferase n=1 Tax=Tenacibaculum finnmarkense genomovar finnmarkense TaxID=1458503 RepID=A0AAP1RGW6_9FLAO|nr:RsmD family RNA methyltransferase [Tenacibaculum finnmarkense]MBE7653388.1 class I SAM-dependent methyltransferase [Tenacibaculum finnmarkense genomovar finnmarkense]MBE7695688.1 class I SAM-dependent methyltransferase [Tenacibaculum finnmarkense genomovar finnmarkense]MCD8427651.1 class I SAM-dependent methyltransferase [Tenacibaculum finnmarkense genomovar finnmarkense]MCD8438866.1 class I SAM-dependent methyltransferase [Tenacibaculum finnmarkense genomovar ulcerans]MCG8719860.1 class I 